MVRLILVAFFIASTNIMAKTQEDIKKEITLTNRSIAQMEDEVISLQNEANELERRVSALQIKYNKLHEDYRKDQGGVSFFDDYVVVAGGKVDPQLEKSYTDTRDELNRVKKELQDRQNKVNNLRQKILSSRLELVNKDDQLVEANNKEESIKNAKKAAIENQKIALEGEISLQKIQFEFDKLSNKFENMDDNLDSMERSLDKAILGAYVQEKITRLLTSDVFCQAKEKCGSGAKIDPSLAQSELFPQAPKNRKGSPNRYQSSPNNGTK